MIVWFQKLSIPPPRKGFFLRLPHLSGNSNQASYIYLNFWAFETPPPPPGISNPFCGGSMDIFWNYTLFRTWSMRKDSWGLDEVSPALEISMRINKINVIYFPLWPEKKEHMTDNSCKKLKNYGDRGGCYTAEVDNTLRIRSLFYYSIQNNS